MARYFFNLTNGQGFLQDYEGQEFPDLETARSSAIDGLRSVVADDCIKGELHLAASIDVVDEQNALLAKVKFADAISIVESNDLL